MAIDPKLVLDGEMPRLIDEWNRRMRQCPGNVTFTYFRRTDQKGVFFVLHEFGRRPLQHGTCISLPNIKNPSLYPILFPAS